jgi:hypothetical protein
MEQSNLPSNPAQVTGALVKADFNIELTKLNYQQVLQSVESVTWTRANINDDLLAPGNFVAKKLTDKKELMKRPFIDAGKVIQNEYNSVFNPLNDALSRKANEKKKLADQIQREDDLVNAEVERVKAINASMVSFISNITNEITSADNEKMIAALEMRIGSEVSRKNIYQELLPTMKQQCEELKPLIKKQKEYIKTLKAAEKSSEDAIKSGDDDKAIEMRYKAEEMKSTIEENKIRLQQQAFQTIENSDVTIGVPTATAPKATRVWWTWEVVDVNTLFKKRPDLVDLVPNKNGIDTVFDRMQAEGRFIGKREVIVNGIRFFEEKSFK